MKKIILLFILTLVLISCGGECQTKECFDYKLEQEKNESEAIEKDRIFELEKMKIQAEIEKNKPVEVKVQELKNNETSIGEGIVESVGIGAGVWILGKALESF